MIVALTAGVLVAGAVYLFLQRGMMRIVLGFVLLSHAANLVLLASGGVQRRGEPLGADPDPAVTADPLPQAFVLTAIVIAFAITIYLLTLSATGSGDDDTVGLESSDGEDAGAADSVLSGTMLQSARVETAERAAEATAEEAASGDPDAEPEGRHA